MKKSEQLKLAAEMAESNIRAYSLYKKADREERYELFIKEGIEMMHYLGFYLIKSDNYSFSIYTKNYTFDYFPKADRVRQRNGNKWIRNDGFNWLINKLKKIKKDEKT